jgi:hypothetical protein
MTPVILTLFWTNNLTFSSSLSFVALVALLEMFFQLVCFYLLLQYSTIRHVLPLSDLFDLSFIFISEGIKVWNQVIYQSPDCRGGVRLMGF